MQIITNLLYLQIWINNYIFMICIYIFRLTTIYSNLHLYIDNLPECMRECERDMGG